MTDRPSIVSLVLLLLAGGCGTSIPSDTATAPQAGSAAASASLVAVSAVEASQRLRQPPSSAPASAESTSPRVAMRESPTALDARQLPADDAQRASQPLPPSIDWPQMSTGDLMHPPADRPAGNGYRLTDPPLPGECVASEPSDEAVDSAESAIAETIGALARRPPIHAVRKSPPAQTLPPVDAAPAPSEIIAADDVDDDTQTMTGPRDWLAAAEPRASERFPLGRNVVAASAEAAADESDIPRYEVSPEELLQPADLSRTAGESIDRQPAPIRDARPPRTMPLPLTQAQRAEMMAVARLADAHSKRGFQLAGRNALYSARAEFVQALGMVAQGLDAIAGGTARMDAMTAGLKALEESDHFVSNSSQIATDFDAVIVARPHHTPVLHNREPGSTSAMQALQAYYGYAQRQLEFAAGRQPAASMSLHGLGKVHAALAKTKRARTSAAEPKAIVFFQAALLADPHNFMAANELGVLLANYGKYPQAKAAFVQSLRVSGQPVTWRNLAVVHGHLGEQQLAQLALQEAKLAAQRGIDQQLGPLGLSARAFDVQWVDAQTLAQVNESPATAVQKPAEQQTPPVTAMPPRNPVPMQR